MEKRTIVVTGGSSGIGGELVRQLAEHGDRVLAISRSQRPAWESASGGSIVGIAADLSTGRGVRDAAARITNLAGSVDGLVNCASAVNSRRQTTEDGLEYTFALNYLSYFHLTGLLFPVMGRGRRGRIINVSAAPVPWAKLDFDDLQMERGYGGARAYIRSKLADVMFTYELARRVRNHSLTVNAVHPGVVKTGLAKETASGVLRLFAELARYFAEDVGPASARIARLAVDPAYEATSGKFFAKGRETRSSSRSYDIEAGKRLWAESVRLLGYDPYSEPRR